MFTARSITTGLIAALAAVVFPLVATGTATASPSEQVSDNVVPMGTFDFPWGG